MHHAEPTSDAQSRCRGRQTFDVVRYLEVVVGRWKTVCGIPFVAGVGAIVYSLCLPNVYTAQTMIFPLQEEKGVMSSMMAQLGGVAAIAGASLGGPSRTDLYVTMLKSDAVKDPIIDRFKLMDVYRAKLRTDALLALDKRVFVVAGKKDGVITISVDDKDPKRAAEIANAYVDELGKLDTRLSTSGSGRNRVFLEERLASARADLSRAEDALKAFQSRHKTLDVTEQTKASIKGVADLKARLASQEVQLAVLLSKFTESSQEVKAAKASIGNMKAQIAQLEGNGGGSSSIPSVGSVPGIGQEYVRLMREFKIQETLVELLTKQYEMARLNEAKEISPFQVIQKAKIPERKSKPARAKLVTTVTSTALFCSLMLVFVQNGLNGMSAEEKRRWKDLFRKKS